LAITNEAPTIASAIPGNAQEDQDGEILGQQGSHSPYPFSKPQRGIAHRSAAGHYPINPPPP